MAAQLEAEDSRQRKNIINMVKLEQTLHNTVLLDSKTKENESNKNTPQNQNDNVIGRFTQRV